ncbi:UNVERIFIED_CONTAM: hypothetical protein FKN15_017163 [Acipenser sinensis]
MVLILFRKKEEKSWQPVTRGCQKRDIAPETQARKSTAFSKVLEKAAESSNSRAKGKRRKQGCGVSSVAKPVTPPCTAPSMWLFRHCPKRWDEGKTWRSGSAGRVGSQYPTTQGRGATAELATARGCLHVTAQGCLHVTARGCLPQTAQGCLPHFAKGCQPRFAQGCQPHFAQGCQPRFAKGCQPRFAQGCQPHFAQGCQPRFPQGCLPCIVWGCLLLHITWGCLLRRIAWGFLLLRIAWGFLLRRIAWGFLLRRIAWGFLLLRIIWGCLLLRIAAGSTVAGTPPRGLASHEEGGREVRRPPTPAAVLLPKIVGEVRRPAPTAALSLPEVLWPELDKRELPATKKGGGQETTPQAAFPLPGIPQLKESAWELSAVTMTALPVAAWLLATLPPMNP